MKYRNIERFKHQLVEDFRIQTFIKDAWASSPFIDLDAHGMLTIKSGYLWDGASGPTIDTANCMRAALVHDALYELMRRGVLEQAYRDDADRLFRDILTLDGMRPARAAIWYGSVRACAGWAAKPGTQKDEIIEV